MLVKKTGKDKIMGKATLISLLGYKNTIKYAKNLILKIINKLKNMAINLKISLKLLDYILYRSK